MCSLHTTCTRNVCTSKCKTVYFIFLRSTCNRIEITLIWSNAFQELSESAGRALSAELRADSLQDQAEAARHDLALRSTTCELHSSRITELEARLRTANNEFFDARNEFQKAKMEAEIAQLKVLF